MKRWKTLFLRLSIFGLITIIDFLLWQKIIYPDNTEQEDPSIKLFLEIVINISHLLITTNSSVNIVVYFLKVSFNLTTLLNSSIILFVRAPSTLVIQSNSLIFDAFPSLPWDIWSMQFHPTVVIPKLSVCQMKQQQLTWNLIFVK